jgi:hypothetical protein
MAYQFTAASSQSLVVGSAPVTAEPLTMACWVRPSVTTNGVILSIGTNGGTSRWQLNHGATSSDFAQNTANIAAFSVDSIGTANGASTDNNVYTVNSWVHAASVFSGSNNRVAYANGIAGTSNTISRTVSGVNRLHIAARIATTVGAFASGDIAEVGIWNAALTAAEIASLAAGMTCDKVRPQSLVFYAPLVRELQDVKGGLTITNNNTATVANHPRVYA